MDDSRRIVERKDLILLFQGGKQSRKKKIQVNPIKQKELTIIISQRRRFKKIRINKNMIKQINIIIYIFRNKHNNLVNKSSCQCQKKNNN